MWTTSSLPVVEGRPDPEIREKAMEMARPLTPRSERPRKTWGSLLMAVPDGGCPRRKCVKRAQHPGECWPKED